MKFPIRQLRLQLLVIGFLSSAIAVLAAPEPTKQPEAAPKEDAQISRIIEAHGGSENLAKVRTIYSRGFQKISQTDNDGWVTRYLQRPDRFRIENALHQTSGARLLVGQHVWTASGPGKTPFKEADEATTQGIRFLFNALDLPFALAEGKWTLLPPAKDKPEASPTQVLVLKNNTGDELMVTVNPKTHLIAMVTAMTPQGKGKVLTAHEFRDYRDVEGIKIPYQIISYYDKKPYAHLTLKEVKLNGNMAGAVFSSQSSASIPVSVGTTARKQQPASGTHQ